MPSDVYDLLGGKFDRFVKGALGLKNDQLNLMAIRRVKIPDPSNWGTYVAKGKAKIIKESAEIKRVRKAANKVSKKLDKTANPDAIHEFIPGITKGANIGNKDGPGFKQLLEYSKELDLPGSRYVKAGIGTGTGIGLGTLGLSQMLDGADDE